MVVIKYIQSICTSLAAVLIPIILAVQGYNYTNAIKDKERKLRFTELAIDILNRKDGGGDSLLRKWAIEVLNRYSDIPFPDPVKVDLINDKINLPSISKDKIVKNDPVLPLLQELERRKLETVVCDALARVNNNSPSPNAAQLASIKLRDVIKVMPASVFSKKEEMIIQQSDKQFTKQDFVSAIAGYKILFSDCYEKLCSN